MTPLVEANGLSRRYAAGRRSLLGGRRWLQAVDDVDLAIAPGETLGLAGESGSGKSTLGRLLIGAIPASGGRCRFDGEDVTRPSPARWRALRREMQLVQQHPGAALDPRLTIADQLAEVLTIHRIGHGSADRRATAAAMLDRVGLGAEILRRFPHELSGGQLQRVTIARALLVGPRFLVCDEPVSALDVSVQAQVLNLLQDLQAELGLTCLLISHDLIVLGHLCRRIAILYLGRIVEIGPAEAVLTRPAHPYTQALLASIPLPDATRPMAPPRLDGEPPDPATPPSGCRFRTRCAGATDLCRTSAPALAGGHHQVACHHAVLAA